MHSVGAYYVVFNSLLNGILYFSQIGSFRIDRYCVWYILHPTHLDLLGIISFWDLFSCIYMCVVC